MDDRNGTCGFFASTSALIHRPNVVSDKLMAFASSNATPVTPLFKSQKKVRFKNQKETILKTRYNVLEVVSKRMVEKKQARVI